MSFLTRFGQLLSIGARVSFQRVNDPVKHYGTIKAIDTRSAFAVAYGAQVSFVDSPFTVTADDCTILTESDKLSRAAMECAQDALTLDDPWVHFTCARQFWDKYLATI